MEYGEVERSRHSRMGLASFVLGVVSVVTIILLVVLAPVLFSSALGDIDPQSINPQDINQDSPVVLVAGLIGLGFLVTLLLTLVGLGLGIAGLVQRRRRRLFAAIGTALNGLVVLGVASLIVFSLVVGSSVGA